MSDSSKEKIAELYPIIVFFAFVFVALLFWCFLSSCLGVPLRRFLANFWQYSVLGARAQRPGAGIRGRGSYREEELWEMQARAMRR